VAKPMAMAIKHEISIMLQHGGKMNSHTIIARFSGLLE